MPHNFSADKPIKNPQNDRFQRKPFSERIANTIVNRDNDDGIVIGIYGAWGEGKTSVLNFIEFNLSQHEDILTMKLNPWRYSDENTLLENFFYKIAKLINVKINTRLEKTGKLFSKYGKVGKFFFKDVSDIGLMLNQSTIKELKIRLNQFLKQGNRKLVIFVDDIDRLDKNEIYSLFRLVKLTADFAKTTYILAFDDKMVASALGERFGSGNLDSGRNFLEKIIQIPLPIPKAQPNALKKYAFEFVNKTISDNQSSIEEAELQRFIQAFTNTILVKLTNPRLANRYGNSISFSIPLLNGEVNLVDLLLIEAIKIFYPRHYDFIKSNPQFFIAPMGLGFHFRMNGDESIMEAFSDKLQELAIDLDVKESEAISKLLKNLFPRLQNNFQSIKSDSEIIWSKNKRIASKDYFNRYFTYCVIEGELSDVHLEDFILNIEKLDIEHNKLYLEEIIEQSSSETLITKLQNYEDNISWEAIKKLSIAIASIGEHFSVDGFSFGYGLDGPQGQATLFIYNLLEKHKNKTEVYELSEELMGGNIPFEFSYSLNNWMRSGETTEEKMFTPAQYKKLAKILREKALKKSGNHPIFETYPEYTRFLLYVWYQDNPQELREYLRKHISDNSNCLKSLLKALTPTVTSTRYKHPYKANFDFDDYKYSISIVDKEYIYTKLMENYAEDIGKEKAKFYQFENSQTDINILRQFMHWYKKEEKNIKE